MSVNVSSEIRCPKCTVKSKTTVDRTGETFTATVKFDTPTTGPGHEDQIHSACLNDLLNVARFQGEQLEKVQAVCSLLGKAFNKMGELDQYGVKGVAGLFDVISDSCAHSSSDYYSESLIIENWGK